MVAAIEKQLKYHDQFLVDGDEGVLYVRTVLDPAVPLSESITQAVGELSIVMAEAKLLAEAFRHR